MRGFLVALAFLTVVPVRFRGPLSDRDIAGSRFGYPVVGALLGAVLGSLLAGWVAWGRSPWLGAVAVVTAWVLLTGALHLDGFGDLCDGLFGGRDRDARLKIMKDPHVGSFAVVGVVLLLLGKFAALAELIDRQPQQAPWCLAVAVVVARCLVWVMAAGAKYPRSEGTGRLVIEACRSWEGFLFAGIALAVSVTLLPVRTGLLAGVIALLAVLGLRRLCQRRLGGVTGDCLGAAIEISEGLMLVMCCQ